MDMPIRLSWANDHDVAHVQAKAIPMNLIWDKSAQWLQSSDIRKIPGVFITPMGTPIMSS